MECESTPSPCFIERGLRYAAWFHELDAWTEYWDIYHPETQGRYYFGDGNEEPGLLTQFLPRARRPAAFVAWTRMALGDDDGSLFRREVRKPAVACAIMEVDALVGGLFNKHFGDSCNSAVRADYLNAMFRFSTDTLPPSPSRAARIPEDDPRKATAARHTLEGDLMWFAWALHLEAAHAITGVDLDHSRRALMLAGIATGCAANFAWRGHRRTRPEYSPGAVCESLLSARGFRWAADFPLAAAEVHALFRIREWGNDEADISGATLLSETRTA